MANIIIKEPYATEMRKAINRKYMNRYNSFEKHIQERRKQLFEQYKVVWK